MSVKKVTGRERKKESQKKRGKHSTESKKPKQRFISYRWSTCRLFIASSSPDESSRRFNLLQQELVLHERDLSTCFLAFDILPQEREQVRGWLLIFGKEIAGELIEKPRGEADVDALFTRLLLRDNVHRVQLHLDENSSDSLHSPQDLSIFCENSAEIWILSSSTYNNWKIISYR